jgi:hypothetical protein
MRKITRQTQANNVADRWHKQYPDGNGYREKHIGMWKKLCDLGGRPNPDDVDSLTENSSWTDVGSCNECNLESDTLIELGEEPDYESSTAYICPACLKKALQLVRTRD